MRKRYLVLLSLVVDGGLRPCFARDACHARAGGHCDRDGKVTYTGTPPKMKPIDMSKEPVCAKEHNPPE